MTTAGRNHLIGFLSGEILPRHIQRMLSAEPSGIPDLDETYHRALASLIHRLLSSGEGDSSRRTLSDDDLSRELIDLLDREIGRLNPEEIGELYERLRGFRVEMGSDKTPVVTPSVRGRRNQGLFYTPIGVVRHIVNQTIDAIDTGNPDDLLDRRILDPAVGTGVFLGEVLEQIVERVIAAAQESGSHLRDRIRAFKDRLTARFEGLPANVLLDDETAVRIHVLEHCLYGVDLDPIAVRVARAHLMRTAIGGFPSIPSLTLRVRVGNALIGAGPGSSEADSSWPDPDREHVAAFFCGTVPDDATVRRWKEKMGVLHWPMEYPEVFGSGNRGFDAVVGNPPYEIVSVKESGIEERRKEQSYYRSMYRTCRGKINTYRLMIERSLTLLRPGGVLGFIVPATLTADSTAQPLRRMIFDETEVIQTVIVPEKARLFEGVTQALLILVVKKGDRTRSINPTIWDGKGPVLEKEGTRVSRDLIEDHDFRVPLIESAEEKELLEILVRHPPFRGRGMIPAVGKIHQGEINLTVHRWCITAEPTGLPLIRGEHVEPFRVAHPSARPGRLDWVVREFQAQARPGGSTSSGAGKSGSGRGKPWEKARIALGRVVNMATAVRLKAAPVPPGCFLGDMTNSITDISVPEDYLLGLLNSRLLNWRLKRTSTNNYLSAAEIEALPIHRIVETPESGVDVVRLKSFLDELIERRPRTLMEALAFLDRLPDQGSPERTSTALALMVELTAGRIRADCSGAQGRKYGCDADGGDGEPSEPHPSSKDLDRCGSLSSLPSLRSPASYGTETLSESGWKKGAVLCAYNHALGIVLDSLVLKLYSATAYAIVLEGGDG